MIAWILTVTAYQVKMLIELFNYMMPEGARSLDYQTYSSYGYEYL